MLTIRNILNGGFNRIDPETPGPAAGVAHPSAHSTTASFPQKGPQITPLVIPHDLKTSPTSPLK